jgi:PilZ domain-containing protein
MGSAVAAGGPASKKVVARVALVNLDDSVSGILRECFRQFGISVLNLGDDAAARMNKEKFEGCALRLDDPAIPVLEAARNSPSNKRLVVFGISKGTQQALRFSRFGINAIFEEPVERQSALKTVRSAHLLVLHELRRYVRIPMVTEVQIEAEGRKFSASTREISAGGMSVVLTGKLPTASNYQLAFALPDTPKVVVNAALCWHAGAESMVGMRFDANDNRRLAVRKWIDDFLDA